MRLKQTDARKTHWKGHRVLRGYWVQEFWVGTVFQIREILTVIA